MTRKRNDRLLSSVLLELQAGHITEAFLPSSSTYQFVHGELDLGSKQITINPIHMTIDTLIHELLHRLYPKWKERYVRRTTTMLRHQLSDAETQQLYDEYQRMKGRS